MKLREMSPSEFPRAKSKYGFTIVELLIVIVVIAVLATISIVAYSGIQQRADRAAIASQYNQWAKVIKLFIAEHEARPHANWYCIGKAADYPADGDFPAGSCVITSSDNGATWTVVNSVDTSGALLSDQLAPYVSGRVFAPHKVYVMNQSGTVRNQWRGFVYDDYSSSAKVVITYAIKGDSCLDGAYFSDPMQGGFECYHEIAPVGNLKIVN
jgi:prepilin-type N-terminal cleavage/methylation domain-containing protein